MCRFLLFLVAALPVACVVAAPLPAVKPKFKLGKDTTVLTGPLATDGYIDYQQALNDLWRKGVTPQSNAVVRLLDVLGPKPGGQEWRPEALKLLGVPAPAAGKYLVPINEFFADERNDLGFSDRESDRASRPWTAEDDPKFDEWLTKNEKPLACVPEALKRKDWFFPLVSPQRDGKRGSLLATRPFAAELREIARALSIRAMRRCGDKKYDDAWRDVLTIYHLARRTPQAGSGIDHLVGSSFEHIAAFKVLELIEAANPTAAQVKRWLADLDGLPARRSFAEAMDTTERFGVLDCMREFHEMGTGALPFITEDKKQTADEVARTFGKMNWEVVLRRVNERHDQAVAAHRQPTHPKRAAALAKLEAELNTKPKDPNRFVLFPPPEDFLALFVGRTERDLSSVVPVEFADMVLLTYHPAMTKIAEASTRTEQVSRNVRVALALAACWADNKKYPAKLADLAPKYLTQVPDDLFADKPLLYTPAKDGYLVYSVGANGQDDGGKLMSDPFDVRGDDLGVRRPKLKPDE